MASANNNTTSLSMGTIGTRQFSSFSATQISSEISRHNYRAGLKSDSQLQKFRNAVYKMVSTWAMEDKLHVINSYGDMGMLKGKTNENLVNEVCTESIIIHLEPSDLLQLYNDIARETTNLKKDIKTIQNKKSKTALNTRTFEDIYKTVENANLKEYQKIRSKDKDYGIPKYLKSQYRTLRNEIKDVLNNCFNKIEIAAIASQMGIEFEDGINQLDLHRKIANKICLFVDLIIGKSKTMNLSSAIMDVKPYEDILQYTSYSYVIGKPGFSDSDWATLKREARRAKKLVEERTRLKHAASKFKSHGKEMEAITGGARALTARGLGRVLERNDVGILADLSTEELLELAGKYGIDATSRSNQNIGMLKARIYNAMRVENKRVLQVERADRRAGNKVMARRATGDILSFYKKGNISNINENTPIVHLNENGSLLDASVLKAVPVFIVGQGRGGERYKNDNSPIVGAINLKRKSINPILNIEQLSEKDLRVYNWLLSLPLVSPFSKRRNTKVIESLEDLKSYLIDVEKVDSSIFVDIDAYAEAAGSILEKNRRYAYVYAVVKGYKDIESYLTTKYGILYKVKTVKRAVARFFRRISILNLNRGIAAVGNKTKDIFKTILIGKVKIPRTYGELPDSAKGIYSALSGLTLLQVRDLWNGKLGSNSDFLSILEKISNDEDKLFIAKAAVAYRIYREKELAMYFLLLGKAIDENGKTIGTLYIGIYNSLIKRASIRAWAKSIRNTFRRTTINTTDNTDISLDGSGNPIINNERYPIPRIRWSDTTGIVESIKDVVPVYIVGGVQLTDSSAISSPKSPLFRRGIGRNAQLANTISNRGGDNSVIFSRSIKDVLTDMTKAGYTPTSKIFSKAGSIDGVGNAYKLSTKDLEWITKNNYKITTGNDLLQDQELTLSNVPGVVKKADILGKETMKKFQIRHIVASPAVPVFVTNTFADRKNVEDYQRNMIKAIKDLSDTVNEDLDDLKLGLATEVVSAPFGVGAITRPYLAAKGITDNMKNIITKASNIAADRLEAWFNGTSMNTGGRVLKAASGATIKPSRYTSIPRLATGGLSNVITGDAAGSNIFKGGARPELVQSNGDIRVVPLNKAGTESKEKVSRMTLDERRQALATAISSHVIRYKFQVPDGAEEISNIGEAIKVFNVKPGITDNITVNGTTTTVADLLGAITAQLSVLSEAANVDNQLLGVIAGNSSQKAVTSSKLTQSEGFPEELNDILGGN